MSAILSDIIIPSSSKLTFSPVSGFVKLKALFRSLVFFGTNTVTL